MNAPATYTPGHAKPKLLMVFLGVVVAVLGFIDLWTPMRLVVFGARAKAEAVSVLKTKAGLPDIALTDDVQVQANLEPRDRSYIFWNEFRFQTADGRTMDVRAPVGSQLKPLYPLLDADGLPTTDLLYYDPAHPETVAFPMIISTWFAPGVLIIVGLGCAVIGAFLLYWANKPIELPHIPPPPAQ